MNKRQGISLIGIPIFIVLVITGILFYFPRHVNKQAEAADLAQQRMELILAQKHIKGFKYFGDPCAHSSSSADCKSPNGFKVSAKIAKEMEGNTNFNIIIVDVGGAATAKLETLVANY